jgi:hypothetical protein
MKSSFMGPASVTPQKAQPKEKYDGAVTLLLGLVDYDVGSTDCSSVDPPRDDATPLQFGDPTDENYGGRVSGDSPSF